MNALANITSEQRQIINGLKEKVWQRYPHLRPVVPTEAERQHARLLPTDEERESVNSVTRFETFYDSYGRRQILRNISEDPRHAERL